MARRQRRNLEKSCLLVAEPSVKLDTLVGFQQVVKNQISRNQYPIHCGPNHYRSIIQRHQWGNLLFIDIHGNTHSHSYINCTAIHSVWKVSEKEEALDQCLMAYNRYVRFCRLNVADERRVVEEEEKKSQMSNRQRVDANWSLLRIYFRFFLFF